MGVKLDYQKLKIQVDDFVAEEREKLLASVFDDSIVLSSVEQAIIDLHLLMDEDLDYSIIYKLEEINPKLYETVRSYNKKTFIVYEKIGYKYDDSVLSLKNRLEIRIQVNELLSNPEKINVAVERLDKKGVKLNKQDFKETVEQYLIANLNIFDEDLYNKIYGYRYRDKDYSFVQKVKDLTGYDYQVKAEKYSEADLREWVIDEINNKKNRQVVVDWYGERGVTPSDHAIDVFILEHLKKFNNELYSKIHNFASHRGFRVEEFFVNNGFGSEGRQKKRISFKDHFSRLVSNDGLRCVRDSAGFVDSYRQNPELKQSVQSLSQKFNVPPAVVVELMCGEKLKGVYLDVDYIELTRNMLIDYLKKHKNRLENLRAEPIYDRLNYIKTRISREDDSDYTVIDVVNFLLEGYHGKVDFGSLKENNYVTGKDLLNDVKDIFDELKVNEGNVISSTKFRYLYPNYHRKLRIFAHRIGTSVEDLFDLYGMNYIVIKSGLPQRMAKTKMDEMPYINEMRSMVEDEMLSRDFSKVSEDERVEIYLSICKKAYSKFQSKMFVELNEEESSLEK